MNTGELEKVVETYTFANADRVGPVSPRLPGAGEAMLSCRIARAVVATAFGIARMPIDGRGRQTSKAILARQVAMYLSHVAFGVAMTDIARVFRRDRTTVTHACHAVEDRRDDRQFDAILDQMEIAALAMRSAQAGWQDR